MSHPLRFLFLQRVGVDLLRVNLRGGGLTGKRSPSRSRRCRSRSGLLPARWRSACAETIRGLPGIAAGRHEVGLAVVLGAGLLQGVRLAGGVDDTTLEGVGAVGVLM